MSAENLLETLTSKRLFRLLMGNNALRRQVIRIVEKRTFAELVEGNPDNRPRKVQELKYHYLMALLEGLDRAIRRGFVSKTVLSRVLDVFLENVVLDRDAQAASVADRLGFSPPLFITISPTGRCNLRCTGCYAASDPGEHQSLDFATFDRILTEKDELWQSHFTVISGGEPFLWRDGSRGLLDMAEKHATDLFMVYTNGTLITEDVARRMGALGNVTPAVSVEGLDQETDARRGKGVHRQVLQAFENLRRFKVPFGISATPTRHNWRVIMSDEFIDFYFDRQSAIYGWIFQYMPVGRGQSLDLMVPPAERVVMQERTEQIVMQRKVFMADFWNSGCASSGCISAGRPGGYFYIDWNGDVTPCVFIPYAVDNIHRIYERGDNINCIIGAPLLRRIRAWQDEYGYMQPAEKVGNWLCPCVIRDHFDVLKQAVLETGSRPINREAEIALQDENYRSGMTRYGAAVGDLTATRWEAEFVPALQEMQEEPLPVEESV